MHIKFCRKYTEDILNKSVNATHIFQLKNSFYFICMHLLLGHYAWLTACSDTLENHVQRKW